MRSGPFDRLRDRWWGRFACGTLRVEHFAKRGFEFFLLSNRIQARLVVEPVETHTQVSRKERAGLTQTVGTPLAK